MESGFIGVEGGFDLRFAGRIVLSHRPNSPALAMACGNPAVEMVRGNFRIEDDPQSAFAPDSWELTDGVITLSDRAGPAARLELVDNALTVTLLREGYDRIHLHFHAESGEAVWGGASR